jgi:hypothetical protein
MEVDISIVIPGVFYSFIKLSSLLLYPSHIYFASTTLENKKSVYDYCLVLLCTPEICFAILNSYCCFEIIKNSVVQL